nr:invertase inhibitor [Tanacetum cinerariifolium]
MLTKIVVHVATKYSTRTRDQFKGLKTGPPGLLKSLKECIPAYNNVIASLKICLKEEACELTGYDIHVAGDEVKRCQTIADDNGAHGSFITPANNVTLDFCTLGESLANPTLQRMMDKALAEQKWRNVEVYLEVVVESKTEWELIKDI